MIGTTSAASVVPDRAAPDAGVAPHANVVGHGLRSLRAQALRIVEAGLAAVDPRTGLDRLVRGDGDVLVVGGRRYDLSTLEHVWVLGAGKASLRIGAGLAELLGDRLSGGLIVVQRGAARPVAGIEIREADHPTPGPDSYAAATALLEYAAAAGPNDLVITAFTGGSSALACLPPPGVSFEAKRDLHRLLLASGAPIEHINAVRKHVSSIKGGRFARAAAPAALVNLSLPDVVSGRLDCITDPSVQDGSTTAEAIAVLRRRGLYDAVDPSIRAFLDSPDAASPDLSDLDIHTVLLTDGDQACAAMSAVATELGLTPYVFGTHVEGAAATVGAMLASIAVETARNSRPFQAPCALIGAGGEAVVTLSPNPGLSGPTEPFKSEPPLGGPNQETALAFAHALPLEPVAVAALFLDTDGSDGGTPNAGAVVDGCTPQRAAAQALDSGEALHSHRSTASFAALDDLLVTGPTHTNVSDMWVVVIDATSTPDGGPR